MVATIRQVAREAKVSIATISRVFNNNPKVDSKTRERILKVIEKTDYHPNISAWRLTKQKASTIGVFMGLMDLSDRVDFDYLSEILIGIMAGAKENRRYDVLLQTPQEELNKNEYIRLFNEQKIDGAIIIYPLMNNPGMKELERRRLPAVVINNDEYKLDSVGADNDRGIAMAFEHLIELGHKRIGLINLSIELNIVFQEIVRIYKETLTKHNMPYLEELVVHGGYDEAAGYEGGKKLLGHKPTAILAVNCSLVVGAVRAIQEAGLRIPEDIAVVGHNEIPLVTSVIPPLTTVRQPLFEMGREAMNVLIRRIEKNPKGLQQVQLPVEFIVRASTKKNGK